MTIECYDTNCPRHSTHDGEEGPFCYSEECVMKNAVKTSPEDGGCWYCHRLNTGMGRVFSLEFDCYLHLECLKKEIKKWEGKHNPELEILREEFDDLFQNPV
jgi:hypothetical protein